MALLVSLAGLCLTDCAAAEVTDERTPRPTGTRRAVTVIDPECSTVIRSDQAYGLGFAWLDR